MYHEQFIFGPYVEGRKEGRKERKGKERKVAEYVRDNGTQWLEHWTKTGLMLPHLIL